MSENHNEETTGHDFDGIQEMNNPMPRWWVYMFYVTMVWGVLYFAFYWAYASEMQRLQGKDNHLAWSDARLSLEMKAAQGVDDTDWSLITAENVATKMDDANLIKRGKSLYSANCAACHGADAKGVVGPDLTDPTTVYGGGPAEVFDVLAVGRASKGMPGWDKTLGRKNVVALTAYVINISK